MKIISQRLVEARKDLGMSQQDVADKLGLSQVGYGDFERGRTLPSIDYLMEVARILQKPVTYFLGIDGDLPPDEGELLAIYRSIPRSEAREIAVDVLRQLAQGINQRVEK